MQCSNTFLSGQHSDIFKVNEMCLKYCVSTKTDRSSEGKCHTQFPSFQSGHKYDKGQNYLFFMYDYYESQTIWPLGQVVRILV